MKVVCANSDISLPVALYTVKPGRVVRFDNPEGRAEYYQVAKFSSKEAEFIKVPLDKHLLMNLATGRMVLKHSLMQVFPQSCTAEVYPTPY
jgi:hypothetical protein